MRIGIEIGGTFTDAITVDTGSAVVRAKVPSTPADLSVGVLNALQTALGASSREVSEVVHGSTVATNALLERKGARLGLITTLGFRDVLEIGRQARDDIYDLFYRKAEPLIPRERTREVPERVGASGELVQELDEQAMRLAVAELVEQHEIDMLVVSFLFAFAEPRNERRAREIAGEVAPGLHVLLSSDVAPIFREYERTSTTAVSGFVEPVVSGYVAAVERRLVTEGVAGELVIMQSNGGLLPAADVTKRPAQMLNSGPAAGVIGAVAVAAELGERDVITLDTGGTSTDVCLITAGAPEVTPARMVDGLPVHVESTDIVSVGAGGGSIAWRDQGGLMRVGPHSAGADPGPACYGRGGREPTVTDALVLLGWLRPQQFLGGRMPLDVGAARAAVGSLATQLAITVDEAAEGIVRIAVANMNEAMRLVSISRGHDPRDYALFAFGGSGGLHAAFVADELGISRIVVPANAGIFSAYGLLVADFKRDYQETRFGLLSATPLTELRATFAELGRRAADDFAAHGAPAAALQYVRSLDLRYLGQGYELTLAVELETLSKESLQAAFGAAHEARYGNPGLGGELEIVTYRLSANLARSRRRTELPRAAGAAGESGAIFLGGARIACRFVPAAALTAGMVLNGPTVVEDATSTTIVPPGWRGTVHESGSLVMERVR
jgi:N-methylhydantoinase A